jgi:transcriptional regulator with XRE-family HTH domain
MQGEQVSNGVQEKATSLIAESRIATQLAQWRHRSGITQEQMAKALNVTQSAISKLESGSDKNITLCQISEYARVTGDRMSLLIGKPFSDMEAVKLHADSLKNRLERLAELANQNASLQSEIKGFIGNTFYNLFAIIALCNDKLQVNHDDNIAEIKLEVIAGKRAPDQKPDLKCEKQAVTV